MKIENRFDMLETLSTRVNQVEKDVRIMKVPCTSIEDEAENEDNVTNEKESTEGNKKSAHGCDHCDYTSISKTGLKIHKKAETK